MPAETAPSRRHRALAIGWLLLTLALAGHNAWLWFGAHLPLDTDVLAMLPSTARDPVAELAAERLAAAAQRSVVVLVAAAEPEGTARAADAYAAVLAELPGLTVTSRIAAERQQEWLAFFAPFRGQLLAAAQREELAARTPAELAERAIAALYQPVAGLPRQGPWAADPLNVHGRWLLERAADSRARPVDGRLTVDDGATRYAVLLLEPAAGAFDIAAQRRLVDGVARAAAAARATVPSTIVHAAGVPLFGAAAAAQAETEVQRIGLGSALGVLLLTLAAFRALRPRLVVLGSIAVGMLAAVSVSALLFERIHVITLVFGASLVGVAENYGTNYYCQRLGRPASERWTVLSEQFAPMALALTTTVVGYALLALAPFPGLRQMALFSVVGLGAAFASVMLWVGFVDRGELRAGRIVPRLAALGPAPLGARAGVTKLALALLVVAAGLLVATRSTHNDDLRALQRPPAALLDDQIAVSRLLDLPSPGQFYLVEAADTEELLVREEALRTALQPAIAAGRLGGATMLADWVPSAARQRDDRELIARRTAAVLEIARARLGEELPAPAAGEFVPLTVEAWLAAPVSEPARHLWLGRRGERSAGIVLLRGVAGAASLPALSALAADLPGVRFVDRVGEISTVLGSFRERMTRVILLSYLLVGLALTARYGRAGWRALAPSALGSLAALAVLAALGQPLTLFHALALLLVLGMGVDYGIFLVDAATRAGPVDPARRMRSQLSITLAAASTLLSFGLLALSATPALAAFGGTLTLGIAVSWWLSPLLLPPPSSDPEPVSPAVA